MLRSFQRCKASGPLYLQRMQPSGVVGWQQLKSTAVPAPVARNTNALAPTSVPKLSATEYLAGNTLTASRSSVAVCAQHTDACHARPALPPTNSPCSTSGREALNCSPSIFGASAVYRQRYACPVRGSGQVAQASPQSAICLQSAWCSSLCCSCNSCRDHSASWLYCGVQN